jgi:broad specificity phosphatase PhoE
MDRRMTTLLLARHGQTEWHAENRYAGSSDVALTATGVLQAEALGRWAVRERPDAVYASDLSRAVLTAAPAAAALGLETRIDPRLREVDFGAGEGMTTLEMDLVFSAELAAFRARPASVPLPLGERGLDAVDRAWPALEEIASSGADSSRALVVMHSTLMRLILCRALGIDPDCYRTVFPAVRNVAITSLTLGPDGAALHAYNVPTD